MTTTEEWRSVPGHELLEASDDLSAKNAGTLMGIALGDLSEDQYDTIARIIAEFREKNKDDPKHVPRVRSEGGKKG